MMSVVEHEVRTAMQKGALLEGQCGLAGTRTSSRWVVS